MRDSEHAASIHSSESSRRFLTMSLKKPTKQTTIKRDQLNSGKHAVAFLCQAALPQTSESALTTERQLQLVRLRALLSIV